MPGEYDLIGVVIVWESPDHLPLIHLRVICAFLSFTFDLSQAHWSQLYCWWGAEGREEGEWEGRRGGGRFPLDVSWVFVNVSNPQGLAELFFFFLFSGTHWRASTLFVSDWPLKEKGAILNQTNGCQRGFQTLWETRSQWAPTSL